MKLGQVINPAGVRLDGSLGLLLEDQMLCEPLPQRSDASLRVARVGVRGCGGDYAW